MPSPAHILLAGILASAFASLEASAQALVIDVDAARDAARARERQAGPPQRFEQPAPDQARRDGNATVIPEREAPSAESFGIR